MNDTRAREFSCSLNAVALEMAVAMPDDAASSAAEWRELVRRFELPLLQYAMRITGEREQARDVVQETFVQFQRSARAQEDRAPAKWLFTVCRNRALNVCRKNRRLAFVGDDSLGSYPAEAPLPDEVLAGKEASGFLLRILATLPLRQQEVVQLKFQNDLSYEEIGAITHLSANHVGVLLHTALKTLRHHYARAAREFVTFPPRTKS